MGKIELNAENPEVKLELTSEFSYLIIQSIYLTSLKNIDKIKLTAELKYVVEGDERTEKFPIHLFTEPRQVEPVFNINKIIINEMFTWGINQQRKFYNILKLNFTCVGNDDNMTINCLSNKISRIEKKGDSLFFGKSPFCSL